MFLTFYNSSWGATHKFLNELYFLGDKCPVLENSVCEAFIIITYVYLFLNFSFGG